MNTLHLMLCTHLIHTIWCEFHCNLDAPVFWLTPIKILQVKLFRYCFVVSLYKCHTLKHLIFPILATRPTHHILWCGIPQTKAGINHWLLLTQEKRQSSSGSICIFLTYSWTSSHTKESRALPRTAPGMDLRGAMSEWRKDRHMDREKLRSSGLSSQRNHSTKPSMFITSSQGGGATTHRCGGLSHADKQGGGVITRR